MCDRGFGGECPRPLGHHRTHGRLAFSITHPCFLTRGSRWIRDEQGVQVGREVGHYFAPARWVEHFRFTDAPAEAPEFAVPRFDRTLSEYVNTLVGAGFALRLLEEEVEDVELRDAASISVAPRRSP